MTDNRAKAFGRIRIATQRLAGKYPFHAKTLERFALRCRSEIPSMGVTVAGDHVQLLYNPQFVTDITLDELGGVLLHEIHHVVFGHILADPTQYTDRWARTVAQEVTVNEFVDEPLPASPILLEQFPDLPPMESTDQRYDRLRRQTDRPPIGLLTGLVLHGQGDGGQRSSQQPAAAVLDDHSVWQEALNDATRSEAALRVVVQDAVIDVGIDKIPEALRPRLQALGIGHHAGQQECDLSRGKRGQLDWVRLLRRFVGRHLAIRPDFTRPARRFPDLVGVLPGKRRRGGRPHILAVIDTSASMTVRLLEQVNGELARLAAEHKVTVVENDARIQRVYPYRRIKSVAGRGGTDLRPPFERSFIQTHRPDLIVYFTDGLGPAPSDQPGLPVLWCLTPHGKTPAQWGEAVYMSNDQERNPP